LRSGNYGGTAAALRGYLEPMGTAVVTARPRFGLDIVSNARGPKVVAMESSRPAVTKHISTGRPSGAELPVLPNGVDSYRVTQGLLPAGVSRHDTRAIQVAYLRGLRDSPRLAGHLSDAMAWKRPTVFALAAGTRRVTCSDAAPCVALGVNLRELLRRVDADVVKALGLESPACEGRPRW
jgi:hypothetical protein